MEEILTTFGVDWRLLIIQAINFGVLLIALYYFLYKPLLKLVNKRQETIEKGVRDAEDAGKKVAEIDNSKNTILAEANQQAEKTLKDAVVRAKDRESEMTHEAQQKSDRIVADATARAEELKREAITESKGEIAKLAVLGAEKILKND